MKNTPAGHADGGSRNVRSSPVWTSEKPKRWMCAAEALDVCSRDQEREAGLAGAVGTQPGATLEQASSGPHRTATLPSPNPG